MVCGRLTKRGGGRRRGGGGEEAGRRPGIQNQKTRTPRKVVGKNRSRTTLDAEMFEKCTPLWRKAHVEAKVLKTDGLGPLLDAEMFKSFLFSKEIWQNCSFLTFSNSKLRKSCRNSLFRSCELSLFHDVSQTWLVLDMSTSIFDGSLPYLLPSR